jgi:3-phosphoinositide dependent protein kinase-1
MSKFISDLIGTAEYVSPEMIESKKTTFSSDLWALGIILYQFFHGKTPFMGNSQQETIKNILQRKKFEYSKVLKFHKT